MKKLLLILSLIGTLSVSAQQIIQRDLQIENMVKQVSADTLKKYIQQLVQFGTRSTLSNQTDAKRGIGAAKNWILKKFNEFAYHSNGRFSAYLDTTTIPADGRRIDQPTPLGNVVGVLKGTDPNDDRLFIITGHVDSRASDVMNRTIDAPGANDDGSGTAAVMECARILSKQSFPATILFVALSGEEQGLLGAHYMADRYKKENKNIVAVLNNDIIGSNNSNETNIIDNTRVRIFSEGLPAFDAEKNLATIRSLGLENDGKARQLARYVKEIGERYVDNLEVILIYRNDRFLRGGDHTAFVQRGFAAVRITEMNENFYHQHQDLRTEKGIVYGDLPEFMDFEYLRKNTALNLACLANLAKAPGVPEEVKIEVRGLGNSTTLQWKAPKNGKPKGYFVLMRNTSSSMWEKKFYTSDTTIQLPYSKDNYFFAVQSVSETGNESQAITPIPGRS